MVLAGLVLLVPRFQEGFARLAAPLASGAGALTARLPAGLLGQGVLGVLLGAVWTPCTGPTLGAAITLASRSESLGRAGVVMFVFGIGAMVPVLALAYGSRRALGGGAVALGRVAAIGKPVMGAALLLIGVLAITGVDKRVETWLVDHMPEWLINLTTSV
jgi:cytochrome c biogenesis protein CcdA